ncbi:FecCD family ABC transporter permease [Herbiconiux ginsengi]|uniref:Iron complex transport system permease protein n=1 Tax=Herbiconiux ginsengi TaxID=381665 RepID=A0A1H3N2E0_9MICO|nr:iron ABC transporter permease [Herbiconiux ginsengi]SDY82409.1 iron complex transport system permease protein [Herbiconiux ginsengi]
MTRVTPTVGGDGVGAGGSLEARVDPLPRRAGVGRRAVLFVVLGVALVVVSLVAAGTGQLAIAPDEVLGSILHRIGVTIWPLPSHPNGDSALWTIRFPRVAMAVLVGAALAASGMIMQAIFGNPLAEPGVVGVSSGAALGAAATIVLGLNFLGDWTIAFAAFVTGLLATLLVYAVSRANGKTEVVTLVLTGIAVNAFAGAGLALFMFLADTQSREAIVFWQLGSLNGSRWQDVLVVLPVVVVGIAVALVLSRRFDLLSLGEKAARHLGVNVEALRIVSIVLVALLVGGAVAFVGIIAFVGLVIPHLMRMIIGPAHLPLLIASTLGGAVLLVAADLVARTAIPMADLPIGLLTSLIGGPFFFWLLRRTRKKAGGWG